MGITASNSMDAPPPERGVESPSSRGIYVGALRALDEAGVPYVVGGRHALAYYTGVPHGRAEAGVYVKSADNRRTLNTLAHAGYRTEYVSPSWHARASKDETDDDDNGDDTRSTAIDVVYGSANGLCSVDDDWFKYAPAVDVLGYATRVCPVEELLWTTAFVQDRGGCHSADVAHLILRQGRSIDWPRLLRRFHAHERVLLAHCVMFGYVYPLEKAALPDWVLDHLQAAARHESDPRASLCRGTLLSPTDYAADVAEGGGFADARLRPHGTLTPEDVAQVRK